MIKSFAEPNTERLFGREPVRRFPSDLHRVMLRKLVAVDAAEQLDELRVPLAIASKSSKEIVLASTVFGSTTSGASASAGKTGMHTTWRSSTITEARCIWRHGS